ncbi:hypothetical protein KAJ89_05380 [Candidatus Parcubacteria bacterium]|nr:hypothetical protein [Candidatus Parcubacteria bacterium]
MYTSLRVKKILKGEQYEELMNDFHNKSQDKEQYPNYSQEEININGNQALKIKYVFGYSGGLDVNILLDVGDYVLHITYYDDTAYVDEYKQIIDSIVVWSSMSQELTLKLKSAISDIDIKLQTESSLWWNDEDGYSILVPGIESMEIYKDDGVGADDFTQSNFVGELLAIVEQVLSARGYILDKRNSSVDETDRRFYDYIRAYENDEELCVIRVNPDYSSHGCSDNMFMCNTIEITCANDLFGSQTEQRPFLEALNLKNKEAIVRIEKQIGDYFQVAVGSRRTGSMTLIKKENTGLRLLYMSQEDPSCEIIEKENIPNNVLEGFGIKGCWTSEGHRRLILIDSEVYSNDEVGISFNYPSEFEQKTWMKESLGGQGKNRELRLFERQDAVFTLSASSLDYIPETYEGTKTYYASEPLDLSMSKEEIAEEFKHLEAFDIEHVDIGSRKALSFYGITSYAGVAINRFVIIPNPGNDLTNIVITGPNLVFREDMDIKNEEHVKEIQHLVLSGEALSSHDGLKKQNQIFGDILETVDFAE